MKREISTRTLLRIRKKTVNMKVTVISIVIGAVDTVTKELVQGLKDLEIRIQMDTIQTTALLKTARILRRVLETRWDLLSLTPAKNHQLALEWKTIKREIIIIIIIIIMIMINQRLANQVRAVIKNIWFSDHEILDIHQHIGKHINRLIH